MLNKFKYIVMIIVSILIAKDKSGDMPQFEANINFNYITVDNIFSINC